MSHQQKKNWRKGDLQKKNSILSNGGVLSGVNSQHIASPAASAMDTGVTMAQPLRSFGIQTIGDLIFSALVRLHPTKQLHIFQKQARQIRRSNLFDSAWYCQHYRLRKYQDPVYHYLSEGASRGYNPSPLFNTRGYLKLYPDVAAANVNPLWHYLQHGRQEKRCLVSTSVPEKADAALLKIVGSLHALDKAKKTIILVTHELSRTGAPILLLNIAKHFYSHYNTIVISLGGGTLEKDYVSHCDMLIACTEENRSEMDVTTFLEPIATQFPVEFAIVNSIVSFPVLRPLRKYGIPIIHLIHEFASNTRPLSLLQNSAVHSSLQVFPAAVVRDNAVQACAEICEGNAIIMPQGINDAPGLAADSKKAAIEQQRIREVFRPAGFPQETVVIAGMGTVQIRKGVDLFIACAKRVAERKPATAFRFVWIGHGYKPDRDEYSLYLEDQIQRSGLQNIVSITGAVAEIETAYQQSDLLLLSSRLDPLPLVSQDTMARGKPVVCFEKATGIAEYLLEDPIAAFGVVPYLDIEEVSARICRLIDDAPFRKEVGAACKRLTETRFCFETYVKRLEELGLELAAQKTTLKTVS